MTVFAFFDRGVFPAIVISSCLWQAQWEFEANDAECFLLHGSAWHGYQLCVRSQFLERC